MRRHASKRYLNHLGHGALSAALLLSLSCSSGQNGPGAKDGSKPAVAVQQSPAVAKQVDEYINRAKSEIKANNFERARQALDKAYELDRGNKKVADVRADLLRAEEKFKATANERAVDEQLASAKKLYDAKRYDDAIVAYNGVLKLDPGNSTARKYVDRSRREIQETKSAQAESLVASARKSIDTKRYDMALQQLEQAKSIDPGAKDVEKLMAEAKRGLAAPSAAVASAAPKAVERTPEPKKAEPKKAEPTPAPKAVERAPEPKKAEPTPAPKAVERAPEPKAAAAVPAADASKKEMEKALERAKDLADKGNYEAAVAAYDKAAADFPAEASTIKKLRDRAQEQSERKAASAAEATNKEARKRAQGFFAEGLKQYESNPEDYSNLEGARRKWAQALEADPTFKDASIYLDDTEAAFNAMVADRQKERDFADRESAAKAKMETQIPINTLEPTPLPEFLRTLKVLSGIDFVLAGGIDARIEAAFTDKPLNEVLDSVLLPIGLKWERKTGEDVVIITPDLRTKVFRVTPDQLTTVDSLLERGTLQKLLYGPSGRKIMDGQEVYTDPRQNVVVLTDSQINIDKFGQLLTELRGEDNVGLIFRSYVIREDKAPQVKALLDAILRVDDAAPYNPERKLIVEGGELIIKDTPDNIRKVEEILQDRQLLANIYSNELNVATFNLTPILEIQDNPDLARQFGENVRQVVETLLYSQEGRSKAQSEGRRLWYDEATLQMTITDYPDRLRMVEDFIESLPQIERKTRSKIVFLNWATAADLAGNIETFLGGGGTDDSETASGTEVTKTMRVEAELEFNGAFFRVTRVNANDENDDNDDDVELIVRTGTTSQDVTIEEFRSEFVEDFEIVAEDVDPSSTPGEGRAKLRIRFVPGGQSGTAQPEATPTPAAETDEDVRDIQVSPIDNLNAMWIQYTSISDLNEVEFWIRTLDVPTLQVSMEVKFVEVVENKARELKADFSIGNLADGISLSDSIVRSRFAQDIDEFRNPFEPFIENAGSANLLKGATVTSWIINNGQSPISLTLRALEAQGVINVVNSPSVTVINGETATFQITRRFDPTSTVGTGTTSGSGTGTGNNARTGQAFDLVDLEISPTVTQAGNITLDPISVTISDFDTSMAQAARLSTVTGVVTGAPDPVGFPNTTGSSTLNFYSQLEKDIETIARIRDGGTIVLGGWRNERSEKTTSGVPILRDIPFIGKFLFSREQETSDRITLLIFLTGSVVRD